MKVAITGSSGLAKNIKDTLEATPHQGDDIKVSTPRIDDILMNDVNWWGFDYDNTNHGNDIHDDDHNNDIIKSRKGLR